MQVSLEMSDLYAGVALPEGGGVPKKVQDEACSGDSLTACSFLPPAEAWQYGWTTADNDHEDTEASFE